VEISGGGSIKGHLIPIKVCRVTSNDTWPLLYLPAEAIRRLGLRKGVRVMILLDSERHRLVIEKVEG